MAEAAAGKEIDDTLSSEVFTRRQRRNSTIVSARLDQRAVELDRRRWAAARRPTLEVEPKTVLERFRADPVSPTLEERERHTGDRAPKCLLEELVLLGAVGRNVEEHSNRRKRGERWRGRDSDDEEDDGLPMVSAKKVQTQRITSMSRASRELEQFFAKVSRGETAKAVSELAEKEDETEPVTFDQLNDSLESVDGDRARTVILLALGPTCRARQKDSASTLPPLPRPARCAAAAFLEIAEAATRLIDLDLKADAAAAKAAVFAAIASTTILNDSDFDKAQDMARSASLANLDAHDCNSKAHDVAHSGLIASALVSALTKALLKSDFPAAVVAASSDDEEEADLSDNIEALVGRAAQRAARDLESVALEARKRVQRCARHANVAAQADADTRAALGLDGNDDDDARERALDWRKELDALARANHALLCEAAKTPTDQSAFEDVASTKRVALTLAAVVRARRGEACGHNHPQLTPIGTQQILHPPLENNTPTTTPKAVSSSLTKK